jgi:hypothetical protein
MSRPLFLRIFEGLQQQNSYFTQWVDAICPARLGPLPKVYAAIRILAYGLPSDVVDEYILSAFRPRGVRGPTSKIVAACPSPDGLARDGTQRGKTRLVLSCAKGDALAVGVTSVREGERECEPVRQPVLLRDHPPA